MCPLLQHLGHKRPFYADFPLFIFAKKIARRRLILAVKSGVFLFFVLGLSFADEEK
jgi:hypothetical protein